MTKEWGNRRESILVEGRVKSWSTWFKVGDATSPYFFNVVTPKRICESIKGLALPDESIMEDEGEILEGVFAHRRKLYKKGG